jgi:hypothetical protein
MATKREREDKERFLYQQKLNNTVDSIIAAGEKEGKTYTKFDRMRLLVHQDERTISDTEFNSEMERIQKLEDAENGIQ